MYCLMKVIRFPELRKAFSSMVLVIKFFSFASNNEVVGQSNSSYDTSNHSVQRQSHTSFVVDADVEHYVTNSDNHLGENCPSNASLGLFMQQSYIPFE